MGGWVGGWEEDVPGRDVKDPEHRNEAVGGTLGTLDVAAVGSDVVNTQADSPCCFADHLWGGGGWVGGWVGDGAKGWRKWVGGRKETYCALLEGVIDAHDRVLLHRQEEARGHLGEARAGVEEGRGGMDEPLVAHEFVRLQRGVEVFSVDAQGDSKEHVLGSLHHFFAEFEEVRSLHGFEAWCGWREWVGGWNEMERKKRKEERRTNNHQPPTHPPTHPHHVPK